MIVRTFTLTKTDDDASIEVLGPEHIVQVLSLQDETRNALPPDHKMFVLPQSVDYFTALLSKKNGILIGVRSKGQLVAQIALMGPMTLEDAIARNAITRNEIPFHHAENSDMVVIAKSMAVHPGWRGNELSQRLLEAALNHPNARTADHVFAQISVDNARSWELFLRHEFGIVAAAIDPTDQKPRFILQKAALGLALHPEASIDNLDPSADFATIMRATGREALVGQLDENGLSFRLAFHASQNSAAAWSDNDAEIA